MVGISAVVVMLGAIYRGRCKYCSQKLKVLRQQYANQRAAAAAKLRLQQAEASAALQAQHTHEAVLVDPAVDGSGWRLFGFAEAKVLRV